MSNTELLQGIAANLVGATANVTSPTFKNINQKGLRVGINITAITAGTLTVTIQGIDASGTAYTLLASAALAGTGFTELLVYPGCVAASNSVANAPLPAEWNILCAVATGPVTATVSYCTEN